MQDEKRSCAQCGHDHSYGILRYSPDGVPFYGARKCWCHCDHFVERNISAELKFDHQQESLPDTFSLPDKELKELWADTSFMSAQVPLATRIAVRQIHGLMQVADLSPALIMALTEFASLVISQVTDIRGAMTRDENKFAHLVAHTDEIVEAMRGVTQLAERINVFNGRLSQIEEREAKIEHDIAGIAAVLQKLAPDSVEIHGNLVCMRPTCGHMREFHMDGLGPCSARQPLEPDCKCPYFQDVLKETKPLPLEGVPYGPEAPHVFVEKIGPRKDEPIVTSVDPDHD